MTYNLHLDKLGRQDRSPRRIPAAPSPGISVGAAAVETGVICDAGRTA